MSNKRTPKNWQAATTSGLAPRDKARLKEAYTKTRLTLVQLQRAFGLTREELQTLCTERGWMRGKNVQKQDYRKPSASDELISASLTSDRDLNTLKRCTRLLLECQMREIERECTHDDGPPPPKSAADREKDARTLANLTRTLEKLTELENADANAKASSNTLDTEKKGAPSVADGAGKSIDEIRFDIERRLRQLIGEDDA